MNGEKQGWIGTSLIERELFRRHILSNFISSLSLEAVVAWLFSFSAIAALVMTSWAYIYQTINKKKKVVESHLSKSEGHFFRRVLPPQRKITKAG
jgi:hypothetical protein